MLLSLLRKIESGSRVWVVVVNLANKPKVQRATYHWTVSTGVLVMSRVSFPDGSFGDVLSNHIHQNWDAADSQVLQIMELMKKAGMDKVQGLHQYPSRDDSVVIHSSSLPSHEVKRWLGIIGFRVGPVSLMTDTIRRTSHVAHDLGIDAIYKGEVASRSKPKAT